MTEATPLPGMEGVGPGPGDAVEDRFAEWVAGLDGGDLQTALGQAAAAEARLRSEYADAIEAKGQAAARGDRQALGVARALAKGRGDAVRSALARTQALRAAMRARKEVRAADAFEPEDLPERFVDVEDFVSRFFAPLIERRLGAGLIWCPKWWKHPEAVNRLWALWRAYEAFRAQGGTALSAWWIYHVDSHLGVLMAEWGPFYKCRKNNHVDELHPLPNEPAPEGWWEVVSMDIDVPVDVQGLANHVTDRSGA